MKSCALIEIKLKKNHASQTMINAWGTISRIVLSGLSNRLTRHTWDIWSRVFLLRSKSDDRSDNVKRDRDRDHWCRINLSSDVFSPFIQITLVVSVQSNNEIHHLIYTVTSFNIETLCYFPFETARGYFVKYLANFS